MKSKVDLSQLKWEIEHMRRHDEIYIFLCKTLKPLGRWKYKKRGDPTKGHSMIGNPRRKKKVG
jgi:hypothetical protein